MDHEILRIQNPLFLQDVKIGFSTLQVSRDTFGHPEASEVEELSLRSSEIPSLSRKSQGCDPRMSLLSACRVSLDTRKVKNFMNHE